jgi:hypothetical protein
MKTTMGVDQVLLEEEEAWKMATHIADLAAREDLEHLRSELASLRAFLAGELEVHLEREEADLFPVLASRGLEVEVAEAKAQHTALRALRAALDVVPERDTASLRRALVRLGDALHRHVRYEADFIYCDLTRAEATVFRDDVDRTLAAGAAGARPR